MRSTPSKLQELSISGEGNNRSVPLTVALLVFILTLVLMGASSLSQSFREWDSTFSHKITFEVPFAEPDTSSSQKETLSLTNQVMEVLQKSSHVRHARIVEPSQLMSVLEPWVGSLETLSALNLPTLVEVDLQKMSPEIVEDLTQTVRKVNPEIRCESHNQWQALLHTISCILQVVAYVVVGLIALTVMILITLITRSGLEIHRQVIDVLHLIGANNRYIARQFETQAFRLTLKGALVGVGFALPLTYAFSFLSTFLGLPEILRCLPSMGIVLFVLGIPLLISALGSLVARISVLRMLSRLKR